MKPLPKSLDGRSPTWCFAALLAFILAYPANPLHAQGYFADPVVDPFELGLEPIAENERVYPSLVDMDMDGDLDLFMLRVEIVNSSQVLRAVQLDYYRNNSTGSVPKFEKLDAWPDLDWPFNIPTFITAMDFVDIDNDGDMDLFSHGWGSNQKILFFENSGHQTAPFDRWVSHPFSLYGEGIASATAHFGDMDGDGDYDAFIGGRTNGSFQYQENIGTPDKPKFAARVANPFGLKLPYEPTGPVFLNCWDFDCDGDLDIMAVLMEGPGEESKTYYFQNRGSVDDPQFHEAYTATGDKIVWTARGDLDGDEDDDLL